MEKSVEVLRELGELVKPLQDFLKKEFDPMTEVRVTPYGADILTRQIGTVTEEDED